MSSTLYKTNLFLQGAPLPQNFVGTPQQWFEAILERTRIVAPFGFSTIVIGGLKPTSNQGPWLKDGQQWYVWSDNDADYVPVSLEDSQIPAYWVQESDPAGTPDAVTGEYLTAAQGGPDGGPLDGGPILWFRLNGSATQCNGVFLFINGRWEALLRNSGVTANRPVSPANLEQYYDTTISTMLHYERGQWRTLDGARGDLKYVSWATAEQALQYNPGWEIYGTGETENVALRGRLLVQATKNPGAGPTTQLAVSGGVNERGATENTGEEEHTLTEAELPTHHHNMPNIVASGGSFAGGGFGGSSIQDRDTDDTGSDQPHNNLPPVHAVWLLRKT